MAQQLIANSVSPFIPLSPFPSSSSHFTEKRTKLTKRNRRLAESSQQQWSSIDSSFNPFNSPPKIPTPIYQSFVGAPSSSNLRPPANHSRKLRRRLTPSPGTPCFRPTSPPAIHTSPFSPTAKCFNLAFSPIAIPSPAPLPPLGSPLPSSPAGSSIPTP